MRISPVLRGVTAGVAWATITLASARAAGVPTHLTTMAKVVFEANRDALKSTGDPERDAMLERARAVIDQSGLRNWSSTEVRQASVASTVAAALGMDLEDPSQWARLHDLLAASERSAHLELLREIAAAQGEAADGEVLEQLVAAFDQARATLTKGMATRHVVRVGAGDDVIELDWSPVRNTFDLYVRGGETRPGAGDGFDLRMAGAVEMLISPDGDDAALRIEPDEGPPQLLGAEDIARLVATVFGTWRETSSSAHPGAEWTIEASGAREGGDERRERAGEEVERLRGEITRIRSDKIYEWRHPTTGEIARQDRFRRLDDPWEYVGQAMRHPDAQQAIASRQARIEELEAALVELPLEAHDPIRMREALTDEVGARDLAISIRFPDGYHASFDRARIHGGRITARRTLRDVRDITNLPAPITSELISSWNPPEWVELELRLDPDTEQPYLDGSRWRLHVTWSRMFGHSVDSIHTPYSTDLTLHLAEGNVAEGAAADAAL